MEDCVIEIRGLWTQFGDMVVHRNIDLSVRRGEIMSLVGGSGSGKTTMLRQMLGLERPARGEVRIFGIDLHGKDTVGLRKLRERWGMLFQEGALFSALTVYENIALPLRELRVIDEELIHDLVMMKLDMVGIEPRLDNIKRGLENSLMLVTPLKEKYGYDLAAKIAKNAHKNGTTLREEAVKAGVPASDFDAIVRPEKMIGPDEN